MTKLLVLDCETTGFDSKEHRVVELAGAVVDPIKKRVADLFCQLVNPERLIPAEAMAVHHILDRQVAGAMFLDQVLDLHVENLMPFIPVAHNAEFDSDFIPVKGPWICTLRCAKHLWPDCPSYGNQTLRYHLKLFKEPEAKAMPPHRARADVWVTAHVLLRLLRERSTAELLELTKMPILLRKVHFGKHLGKLWSEVDRGYLQWILKQDFDRDVMHTARHYV